MKSNKTSNNASSFLNVAMRLLGVWNWWLNFGVVWTKLGKRDGDVGRIIQLLFCLHQCMGKEKVGLLSILLIALVLELLKCLVLVS